MTKVIKTTKKPAKTDADRIEEFDSLTGRQRRVKVARDVLRLLRSKAIKAKRGSYLYLRPRDVSSLKPGNQLRSLLKKAQKEERECQVCALGALLVAHVDRFNACAIRDVAYMTNGGIDVDILASAGGVEADPNSLTKHLERTFSKGQMVLIELAFERGGGLSWCSDAARDTEVTAVEQEAAIKFGMRRGKPSERLVAIMENVIENNGTFVP